MPDDQEQRRRDHGGRRELPAPFIGGVWAAVFLVLFGAFTAAVAVVAVTAVLWLLWRAMPRTGARAARPAAADADAPPAAAAR